MNAPAEKVILQSTALAFHLPQFGGGLPLSILVVNYHA